MERNILASVDELRSLRERIDRKPFDSFYEVLRKRCNLILETSPVTETQWRGQWGQGRWGAALIAARTAQGRILDLLIAHYIDRNDAYRDRAIEELKNLVGWSTWVDPCHASLPADLCTAEAAVAAVIGLDWCWDDLSPSERGVIVQAIRTKAIGPYCEGVERQVSWANCYHNWNAVVNGGCGLAGLALRDEDAQCEQAYRFARAGLKHFLDALGREGGWDEGTGYWGYAMRYALLFGEGCSRLLDDQTIIHSRGMDVTGLFPIYFTPNGRAVSFGDSPAVPLYGTLYLLVKYFRSKELTWWLDTYAFHRDVSTTGWSAAGLAMLFRPPDIKVPRRPRLQTVKVFEDIGWGVLADNWPRPQMYVAVKTGDLSANHSQHDMNSIQLQVDGEILLTDIGDPPYCREYFSEQRGEFYEVQGRAHNTIVVAGRDQQIDAQGSIVQREDKKDYRLITCDAGDACGDNTQFMRGVVLLCDGGTKVGHTLVVLDELTNGVPEKVELYWHTHGEVAFDGENLTGTIIGRESKLHFALASTVNVTSSIESRPLRNHRVDRVVCISAGVMGRSLFASIFSRDELQHPPELEVATSGNVRVEVGATRLDFVRGKRCLELAKVVVG